MPAEYEVLEPGGHQAFADAVKSYADRAGGTGTTQLADGSVTLGKLAEDVNDRISTYWAWFQDGEDRRLGIVTDEQE